MSNKKQIMISKIIMTLIGMLFWSSNGFADKKHIVLSTCNYSPYYAEALPDGGYFTDIARKAFQRAGYMLEIKWVPWKRALLLAKKGKTHGVLGIAYNDERTQHFIYSDVIDTDNYVFFARKGHSISYKGLSDLKTYRVGVWAGSIMAKELKSAGFKRLQNVTRDDQNVKKLLLDRIDCFPGSERAMLYYINNNFPEKINDIVLLKPPYKTYPYYITISKKSPNHATIITDFNKGLLQIRQDGTIEKILKKYGMDK